ncbi:MarR family winged helix-turn-helix transcriptional regulator [Kribbella deserti]|uniref:MarR family winged helix-turn-helix transcriptional regulator n=1 Tax=Kribbella deserti TaxID=1926257 RepID=A0ABV6QTK3_9ACTN
MAERNDRVALAMAVLDLVDTGHRRISRRLDVVRLKVLATVVVRGPVRPGEIALELGLTAPTVSRHLAALEDEEHVTLTVDPGDGRTFLVAPTVAGRRALRESVDASATAFATDIADWTDAQVTAALTAINHLNTPGPNHPPPRPHPATANPPAALPHSDVKAARTAPPVAAHLPHADDATPLHPPRPPTHADDATPRRPPRLLVAGRSFAPVRLVGSPRRFSRPPWEWLAIGEVGYHLGIPGGNPPSEWPATLRHRDHPPRRAADAGDAGDAGEVGTDAGLSRGYPVVVTPLPSCCTATRLQPGTRTKSRHRSRSTPSRVDAS